MPDEKRILNKEQREAVEHGDGPLLIIAGAGTGKTTVITERIKYLILEKNLLPSEILALTFTDKAAREMEERVDVALPYGYTQMWISTFHSFCDRLLRQEALHIGLSPAYKLMTESETILFLRKHLFKFDLDYFRPLGNPNKFLDAILQHFSRLKDEDVSPNEYLHWAQSQKSRQRRGSPEAAKVKSQNEETQKCIELASAYKLYEELKAKEGVMDFADLISNALKLLRTRKNVLTEYQRRFKYILVDEFQDTNYAQNELAILLAGAKQNIAVVGDDDQAIYRWRGAAVSNIIQFKKHYAHAKIIVLPKNYRSTQAILDSSYKLIQNNNPDRLEVKEKIDKKLESIRKIKGDQPTFMYTSRVEDEADEVAKKIKELVTSNTKHVTRYEYKDIAILVRANNHADPFIRAFERYRIPYQFLGPGQLFRQEEIKDLIAYLKVLYNFEDSVSLYRVLSMEHFDISARDLAAMINFARRQNLSLFEAAERIDEVFVSDEIKEKIKFIVAMIHRHLKRMRDDSAGQIVYYFLEDSSLLKKFMSYKTKLDEKRAQNIAKFFDKLKTFEVEHEDAGVTAVVDWIDLSMQMGESPLAADADWSENNAVNILTIHSSKGLEFPVVFLVNLVTGRFPTRERREQIPVPDALIKEILPEGDFHLEEERRLFYVGMTRARDFLFLTAANYYGEGKRERKLSPFVFEALGEKVEYPQQYNNSTIQQLSFLEWKPVESQENADKEPRSKLIVDYLSYSQIDTFNTCPMHYKAKYILRIPVAQTSSQSFGTSVHLTLRDFYQLLLDGKKPTEKDIITLLEKNWINEGYHSSDHERQMILKGKKILQDFLKSYFDPKRLPLSLELPFQFRINTNGKTLRVGGKIDRIDKLDDGRIEVLDYKTGVNMPDEKKLVDNLQLTVYALAALEVKELLLGKKPEDVILSLYYLESGKKFTTTRTAEQLAKAKEELLAIADKISVSDFACSGGTLCVDCEFKMLCGNTS